MDKMTGILIAVLAMTAMAADKAATTENKNVTIISAQSSADGKSTVAREVTEECIVSLPSAGELEAMTEAKTEYLKDINGKDGDDRYVKTFAATVTVNYLVRQKELLIVTTNSVTGQEPVIKEVTRTVRKSHTVTSDAEEGDLFAGNSPRRYYFSSAAAAAKNARARAAIWLKQNKHVVCPE